MNTLPTKRQQRRQRAKERRIEIVLELNSKFEKFYDHQNKNHGVEFPLLMAWQQLELHVKSLCKIYPEEAHMYRSSLITFHKYFNEIMDKLIEEKSHDQKSTLPS